MNWDYVYNWNGSSAVAVDPYWMITAAHVADDRGGEVGSTIDIGGSTYTLQEILYHEATSGNPADLALLRFDKALPGYYELYDGTFPTFPPRKKLDVILVGYGVTGVDNGSYFTWTIGTEGTERWGTNTIDGEGIVNSNGFSSQAIVFDYDSGETDYEAGFGEHDSGGGTFVNEDGIWKLAGVNAYVSTNGIDGQYNEGLSISVPAYNSWITSNVPEPATLSFLAMVGVALIAKRQKLA